MISIEHLDLERRFKVGNKVVCTSIEDYGFSYYGEASDCLDIGKVYEVLNIDYSDPSDPEEYRHLDSGELPEPDFEWAIEIMIEGEGPMWFHVSNFSFLKPVSNEDRIKARREKCRIHSK